jgi:hypothetical protein
MNLNKTAAAAGVEECVRHHRLYPVLLPLYYHYSFVAQGMRMPGRARKKAQTFFKKLKGE